MKKKVEGICHICKAFGPLSEEHIPPKAAFNNGTFIPLDFNKAIELGPDLRIEGRKVQGGVRRFTLCRQCNNHTGGWYSRAFAEWCYKGAEILERTHGKPTLIVAYKVFPLRILKQIVTMMFSVNEPTFGDVHPYLRQFIMNKEMKGLPPGYGIYIYYNQSSLLRYHGISGTGNFERGGISVFSEINFPPFGYVLCIRGTKPPHRAMFDITYFANYGYFRETEVFLQLPVLATDSPLPGHYATKSEMLQAKEENDRITAVKENQTHLSIIEKDRCRQELEVAANLINIHK